MRGSGSTLGELGQCRGSGMDQGWWGVCIQTVSRSWGSDLGRGSWEDGTLMLWRLRGDFRLRREKVCLHSGQFFFPTLLFFSLGVRTTLPPTTAGTVIHPWAGENTQILGTCPTGSLTAQKRKESEEPWLLGSSQGITLGQSPALMSRVKCSHARGQRRLLPMLENLRNSHLPLSVAPHLWGAGPWMFDALSPEAQGEEMSWVLRGCLGRAAP